MPLKINQVVKLDNEFYATEFKGPLYKLVLVPIQWDSSRENITVTQELEEKILRENVSLR